MSTETKPNLEPLVEFLKNEKELEEKGQEDDSNYDKLRFIGYALDIGYDKTTIITSDPYKINVGGIPRNSFLIMVPQDYEQYPPNVIILQVLDAAETPLRQEVQQTYFELHKKSMPELDRFTQNELQWGALETDVLGMFYHNPKKENEIEFSHDLVNYVSAHKYRVYSPSKEILDIITNALIPTENRFSIGKLRTTENRLGINEKTFPDVDVKVSTKDFLGSRTALFGKTRLGKSNTVKIIAQSVIETTREQNVGQLIFDIDGEYANDNPQDENLSIKTVYSDDCVVYSFNPKDETIKPLKLNFYEHPNESIRVLGSLLEEHDRHSIYIKAFTSSEFPPLESLKTMEMNEKLRVKRRILMYWAILEEGGFHITDEQLPKRIDLNPTYSDALRQAAYDDIPPTKIRNLKELVTEFKTITRYIRRQDADKGLLQSKSSGNPLFDVGENALLNFLLPTGKGAGPALIVPFHLYHDPNAGDSNAEILGYLDERKTVILDLSNAHPTILEYFSKKLALAVFQHQEQKFVENQLPDSNYVQLYFEEAHNLFPKDEGSGAPDIYKRIAKEGAKFHIGMIYSTQSVTTINPDLLAQTENFFIAHMSSQDELRALIKTNLFFKNFERDILKAKTVGYLRIITRSHRYVIPVQIKKFDANQIIDE